MPTLEDTAIDFPVTTLNDVLEAEAKTGVPVGADEEKYRKWAFISTGAASLLAIILAVVLITGGGSDDGGGDSSRAQTAAAPPNTAVVAITGVGDGRIPDPKAGNYYKVTSAEDGSVLSKAAMLTSFKKGAKHGSVQTVDIQLAVAPSEETALNTAKAPSLRFSPAEAPAPGQPAETPTTTTPAAETPAPPTPEAPAPEAPATTQPAG